MKSIIYSLVAFLAFCGSALAQPSNTSCGTATVLTNVNNWCSAAGAYSNVNGSVGNTFGAPACWPTPYNTGTENDVWFSFTAPTTNVLVTVNGNTQGLGTLNSPIVALYSGNCAAVLVTEGCGVSAPGSNTVSIGSTALVPGTTYYIRVDGGYNGSTNNQGTFQLCVSTASSPIPSNDDCGTPLTLSNVNNWCSTNAQYTNVLASNSSFGAPACWPNTTNDVWFQFTATASALIMEVFGDTAGGGTLQRPEIALYSGSCLAVMFTEGCAVSNPGSNYVNLSLGGLIAGTTYLVRIDGVSGNTGTFRFCINNFEPAVSPGQDCSSATRLCNKNSFTVANVSGFGVDGAEAAGSCLAGGVSTGGNTEQNSVWYTWTAANNGTLTFDIIPLQSGIDIDFVVYQFDPVTGCAGRTMLRCEAASCPGATGLNTTATDVTEPFDCVPPAQDNYLQQLSMTAGTTYGLLVNVFQQLGQGFTINFGGTGQFAGPVSNFTQSVTPSCNTSATATFTSSSTNVNASSTYSWTFGAGASPANANTVGPHTVTYSTPGVKTIMLTVADPAGCDSTIFKQITIADTLSVNGTIVNPGCGGSNGSITVSTTGGNGTTASFQYSINGGPYGSSNVFSGLSAGTYTITVKDSINCTKSKTFTLTTSTPPAEPTATTPVTYCQGATTSQLSATGTNLLWYTSSTGGTGSATAPTPSSASSGTTLYYVSQTVSGCEGPRKEITVTVNAVPAAPAATSPVTYCQNATASQLTATGTNLLWYNTATAGTGSATAPTPSTATAGTTSYYVSQSANGCESSRTQITVTVNATPSTPGVVTPVTYCQNATATQLTATGSSLQWYTVSTGGTGTSTAPTPSTSSAGTTTYYVSQTVNNCESNRSSITVNVNALPAAPTVTSPVQYCQGAAASQLTATGTNLSWYTSVGGSASSIAPTPSTSATGTVTYYVTQTVNSCQSANSSISVVVNGNPTVSATSTSTGCGAPSGTITATGANGAGGYCYSLNGGICQASNAYSNLGAGNYVITVMDVAGCTGTTNVSVTSTSGVNASVVQQTNVTCFGQNNGSVEVAGSGGTGPFDYSINGGPIQASGIFSGLIAGNYTITVTDQASCSVTQAVVITQPTDLSVSASTINATCGNANGSITTAGSNGTSPYQYALNAGAFQAGSTFSSLSAGTYTVRIKDNNNCVDSIFVSISQSGTLTSSITSQTNVTCFGGSDGSFTVTGNGSNGYTYSFNGGPFISSGSFSNLSANTFAVTVKDSAGCTSVLSVTISEPTELTLSNTVTNASCGLNNGSITATGSNGSGGYLYSTDGTNYSGTSTFSGLSANSYTVFVKDVNGCIESETVTVTQSGAVNLAVTSSANIGCYGGNDGSITVDASGTGGYLYSLNGGTAVPSNTFSNLIAGLYSIVVTDQTGCSDTALVTLTEPVQLQVSATTSASTCGGSNGSITASGSNGTGAYGFSIDGSNFSNTSGVFSNLIPGPYTVTIKDDNGCTDTSQVNVGSVGAVIASVSAQTNVSCFGGSTGAVTVDGSGSTGYSYALNSGSFGSNNTFQNLIAGTYVVTVKDNNQCTDTVNIVITQPAQLTVAATTTSATCNSNNGVINASGTGGTGSYLFDLNSGATQSSGVFNNLAPASYTVNITDSNQCTSSVIVNVGTISSAAITANSQNVTCFGTGTGSITASGTGSSGYLFSLNGGTFQSSGAFTGLIAGTYEVVLKDVNQCTDTITVVITSPIQLDLSASSTQILCNGSTATLTAGGSGGTTPYQYSLNGGNLQSSGTFSGLSGGSYLVTVRDSNACTDTMTVAISEPSALTVSSTIVNTTCGYSNGSITATGFGGIAPYLYSTDGTNFQNSGSFIGQAAGNYTITVKDFNGCIKTENVTIQSSTGPVVSVTPNGGTICTGASLTMLATGAYSYVWSPAFGLDNSNTDQVVATPTVTTSYQVVGTDPDGCTDTAYVTVTVNSCGNPSVSISGDSSLCTPKCGNITATVAGASGNVEYTWIPNIGTGAGPYTVCPTTTTTYYLTITETSTGKTANASWTVEVEQSPEIIVTPTEKTICNGTEVTLKANGAATYAWLGGEGLSEESGATVKATPLESVTYQVIGMSTGGCSDTAEVKIVVEPCGEIFVPNAFSPNGDGENDVVKVFGGNIVTMVFRIYNRWGEQVFEASSPSEGWDGKQNGQTLDPSVFVYYLDATLITGEIVHKQGNISLIK